MSESKQLVEMVVTLANTTAALVASQMRSINDQRRDSGDDRYVALTFVTVNDCRDLEFRSGLRLEARAYRSHYSLAYRDLGGGRLVLPVGDNLPKGRLVNAAENILAMIKRGRSWSDAAKKQKYPEAYGASRQPGRHRSKRYGYQARRLFSTSCR